MNTEQRARFEAWYDDNRADAPTAWETFQAAETPLLASIAELEGQLANREPFVVMLPDVHYLYGNDYYKITSKKCFLVDDVIASITAAGGRCV